MLQQSKRNVCGRLQRPIIMSEKREVTIRNIVYESMAAAAISLGVHRTTVVKAKERGSLEYVGLGKTGPRPFTVRCRGQIYASVKECAKMNNVAVSTVYSAINSGREDWIGARKNKLAME